MSKTMKEIMKERTEQTPTERALSTQRDSLVTENTELKREVGVLKRENEKLKKEVQKYVDKALDGPEQRVKETMDLIKKKLVKYTKLEDGDRDFYLNFFETSLKECKRPKDFIDVMIHVDGVVAANPKG